MHTPVFVHIFPCSVSLLFLSAFIPSNDLKAVCVNLLPHDVRCFWPSPFDVESLSLCDWLLISVMTSGSVDRSSLHLVLSTGDCCLCVCVLLVLKPVQMVKMLDVCKLRQQMELQVLRLKLRWSASS